MSSPTKTSASTSQRILSLTNHLKDSSKSGSEKEEGKMNVPYKFQGWMGLDKEANNGKMVWQEFEPKTWTENDVDIKIAFCSICGSDIHTLRSGWGPTLYPCCVGHEIAGVVVKVGQKVQHVKVGDRVGIGAQSGSCLDCEDCSAGLEQYCKGFIETYNGKYPDGSKSYGGYGDYARAPGHFVVKIPDGLSLAEASPMLCGGITTFSPLRNNGAGPGKRVGIIGIGGLGHFGILWAKAMGCDEVVAISRTGHKKEDVLKLGATKFIATDEEGWHKTNARTLDLIVSTVSSPNMPLSRYFALLRVRGQFIQVGSPEDKIPAFHAFSLIGKGCKMGGSSIGSPADIAEMLDFAVKHQVHPIIEERSLQDANQAVVDMGNGDARFRYVLRNEKHIAELQQYL